MRVLLSAPAPKSAASAVAVALAMFETVSAMGGEIVTGGSALPVSLTSAPPNTWKMIDVGGYGQRNSVGLVFLPDQQRFLLLGGAMQGKDSPYSEVTLNLEKSRWENYFPVGKEGRWGPVSGPCSAPGYAYRAPAFQDVEGNFRPNLRYGYNHTMELWGMCAFDRSRGKVIVPWHVLKRNTEYDPKSRTWQFVETADEAPSEFWDDCVFGAMCYDPLNREVLAGQGRWVYRGGMWEKRSFGSPLINGLRDKIEQARLRTRQLIGACRARFYVTESDAMAKGPLDGTASAILRDLGQRSAEVSAAAANAHGHEKVQLGWAGEDLQEARERLNPAVGLLKQEMTTEAIHAVEGAWESLDAAAEDLAAAPPRRAFGRVACDEDRGKIVLFGGHGLDRLVADTWVYDCKTKTWQSRRPALSPSPRAGHGLVWLPGCGKVLLVDGFQEGYKAVAETWTYDLDANQWALLAEGEPRKPLTSHGSTWGWQPEPSAAGPGDVVVTLSNRHSENGGTRFSTWVARIDATKVDAEGTRRLGGPHGTVIYVGGKTADPRWYEQNAGRVDTAAQQAWLDRLPANTWVLCESAKNRPEDNRAWGTAVLDPEGDQVLHWGGGHVAYTGNSVLHYSLRSNQYFIGHRPEDGLMYAHGQGGMKMAVTYRNRAFMTGHSYHSQAYHPGAKKLIVCGQDPQVMVKAWLFFGYDPQAGEWLPGPIPAPFPPNYAMTVLCSVPSGVVAWNGPDLWRLDQQCRAWEKLPLTGCRLPEGGPDLHGMTYDSHRARLLLFSRHAKGDVVAYDMKSGQAARLAPAGMAAQPAMSCREVVYLPQFDSVLVGCRVRDARAMMRWAVFDCEKNAWKAVLLSGDDPISGPKGRAAQNAFSAELGLMHDAKRRLIWAVDSHTNVFALRLDLKTADSISLAEP
jgi:hypothetical protein